MSQEIILSIFLEEKINTLGLASSKTTSPTCINFCSCHTVALNWKVLTLEEGLEGCKMQVYAVRCM